MTSPEWVQRTLQVGSDTTDSFREFLDLYSDIVKDLTEDASRELSNRYQEAMARYSFELAGAFADSISLLGPGSWSGDATELRMIRNELELKLRRLKLTQGQGVHWFEERGGPQELRPLREARIRDTDSDSGYRDTLERAERAIIWRVSQEPAQWLEALKHAGSDQELWLVTALLSRLIHLKNREQLAAWGNTDSSAAPLIDSSEQLEALLGLLKSDDPKLRAETVFVLAEGAGAAAIPELRKIAMDSREISLVRTHAFRALGVIGGSDAVDALLEAIVDEHELDPLSYALYSLRQILPKVKEAGLRARIAHALIQVAEFSGNPRLMRSSAEDLLNEYQNTKLADDSDLAS